MTADMLAQHPRPAETPLHSYGDRRAREAMGGGHPIVVQSMTNTDTADAKRHRAAGGGAVAAPVQNSCASP